MTLSSSIIHFICEPSIRNDGHLSWTLAYEKIYGKIISNWIGFFSLVLSQLVRKENIHTAVEPINPTENESELL